MGNREEFREEVEKENQRRGGEEGNEKKEEKGCREEKGRKHGVGVGTAGDRNGNQGLVGAGCRAAGQDIANSLGEWEACTVWRCAGGRSVVRGA